MSSGDSKVNGYWRKADEPVWSFWGRGIWPLLGLLVVLVFATWVSAPRWVEAQVQSEVSRAVRALYPTARVEADGQDVVVSLPGNSPEGVCGEAWTRFQDNVREHACATTFGGHDCVERVKFSECRSAAPVDHVDDAAGGADVASQKPLNAEQVKCEAELARAVADVEVRFESASARLVHGVGDELQPLVDVVEHCEGKFVVEGHSDDSGLAVKNVALSRARAEAVRAELIRQGVEAARLRAVGVGSKRPIANNATPEGRALNRRIEIHVVTE